MTHKQDLWKNRYYDGNGLKTGWKETDLAHNIHNIYFLRPLKHQGTYGAGGLDRGPSEKHTSCGGLGFGLGVFVNGRTSKKRRPQERKLGRSTQPTKELFAASGRTFYGETCPTHSRWFLLRGQEGRRKKVEPPHRAPSSISSASPRTDKLSQALSRQPKAVNRNEKRVGS